MLCHYCVYRSEEQNELSAQTQLNKSSHTRAIANYNSKHESERSALRIFHVRPRYSGPHHSVNSKYKIQPYIKPKFNIYSDSQVPKDLSVKPDLKVWPISPHLEITSVPKDPKRMLKKESGALPARLDFHVLPVETELEELPAPTEIIHCKAVSFILFINSEIVRIV